MLKIFLRNESDLPLEILGKKLDSFNWSSAREGEYSLEKIKWHDDLYMADKEYNVYIRKSCKGYNVRVALVSRIRYSKFS